MKWLLTTARGVDAAALAAHLEALGCNVESVGTPIPMDGDDQVFEVEASADLPARAAGDAVVRKVSPSSTMRLL